MTVFVVTLFLPYTINFGQRVEEVRAEDLKRAENNEGTSPTSYFSLPRVVAGPSTPTAIPLTPGATTETEKIFIPEEPRSPFQLRLPTSNSKTKLRSLIRPEPLTPAWGQNLTLNQPKSQARSPPPASILKHVAPIPTSPILRSRNVRSRSYRRSPSGSHDTFSHSNFSVGLGILGNGGLVSALDAASDQGILDDKTWVGTIGIPTDAIKDDIKSAIAGRLACDYESLAVWVNDNDLNGHYENYCKTILWPVLHYQIPDHPKSKAYEDHSWVFYERVNKAFAETIIKNYKRGDVIWIHDYHLLLVPHLIRKEIPDAQIGFYLHTAFPSSEIFRCLAMRSILMEGILGANMIGFQTEEYVHHFLQSCGRLLNVEATSQGVILEDGRLVYVDKFPIGIDPATIDVRRQHSDVQRWVEEISYKYAGKKLIVARDKLDSVRGIRQKMLAYEIFLNTWPEYGRNVVLIQIATSTTEDPFLSSTIAEIVARINSNHSTLAHQPLVYLKQDINYSQWLGLLMISDGLMVTSLREGMNLTGHEYIYCQDGELGTTKHSPLIISEFTGSAALMKDSALLVNPWDLKQCAAAIKIALDMSPNEKEIRWKKMYDAIVEHDAINWYKSYVYGLEHAYKDHSLRDSASVPRLSFASLSKSYNSAPTRLLILDYDGTLASWNSPSSIALTAPKKTLDVLNHLVDDRKNTVYVMSCRRPDQMENLFRSIPGIGMIAENGAFVLEARSSEWIPLVDLDHIANWKDGVQTILKYYEQRIEKSEIEELDSALVFNYANCPDKQAAFKQAGECANHINDACLPLKVVALPIDDGLSVSDAEINKSSAARMIGDNLLRLSKKGVPLPQFLMVIGDSREDEYVFEWAHKMQHQGIEDVFTISVGQRNTAASCSLNQGVPGVISTLQKLTGHTTGSDRLRSSGAVNGTRNE